MNRFTAKLCTGDEIEFARDVLTVIGTERNEGHEFTSSGGGGWVGQYGGRVAAPQIHDHKTVTDRIWVKDSEGKESNIDLTNKNLPFRVGQILSRYSARRLGGKEWYTASICNDTTNLKIDEKRTSWRLIRSSKGLVTTFWKKLAWLLFIGLCLASWAAGIETEKYPSERYQAQARPCSQFGEFDYTKALADASGAVRIFKINPNAIANEKKKKFEYEKSACLKSLTTARLAQFDMDQKRSMERHEELVQKNKSAKRILYGSLFFTFLAFCFLLSASSRYSARRARIDVQAEKEFWEALWSGKVVPEY